MNVTTALAVLLPIMIVLLLLTSFFSASETAITSINVIRLKQIAKGKKQNSKKSEVNRARKVYRFVKEYNRTLATILLANTLINAGLATVGALFFSVFIQNEATSTWVATLVMGFVILIIGEMTPKTVAKLFPEKFCIVAFYPLWFFITILWPFTWVLTLINVKRAQPSSTENELLELISTIESEGVIETNEKQLIESAITFDEKKVSDVMTDFEKAIYVYDDITFNDLRTMYIEEKFTRVPVLSRATNEVIGMINFKDVLLNILEKKVFAVHDVLRPCLFISARTKLDDALEYFQQEQRHLAIVTPRKDSKKAIGLITMEDLLEELVGEIYDEDDLTGNVKEIGHHMYWVYGHTEIKKFFKKQLLLNVAPEDYEKTLYEWFVEKTGYDPKDEHSISQMVYHNYSFRVKKSKVQKKAKNTLFEVEKLADANPDADLLD